MMLNNPQPHYAVLEPVSGEFLGVATSNDVSEAMQSGQWHTRITEVMQHARNIPQITISTSLDEAQDKLTTASSQVLAVYDGLHFKGLITANDIYRVFQFLSQSRQPAY
jgi:predicted transcriptional regulator